jgi:hypothetical protein
MLRIVKSKAMLTLGASKNLLSSPMLHSSP